MALENDPTFLSLVVPAYNEEKRIKQCLLDIKSFFGKMGPNWEALIVIEKSTDATVAVAKETASESKQIKIIENTTHQGKGYAVKTGMLAAKGEYVIFMDADLSTPLVEVFNFLSEIETHPEIDVLIGDRKHGKSKIIKKQNWFRQKAGEFFNLLVQLLIYKGIQDTQCGFKLFRKKVVKPLFEPLKTQGFAFDVEILLRAKKLHYKVRSMPVQWVNSPHSKVSFLKDSFKMLFDILIMRIRGV